ncbi:MAG: helix-hairpin-helix domain-containing protein [Candidatus Nanoarchaeia archaeon]
MVKFTKAFKDTFNRVKERVTNSSKKKDTKYGTQEVHHSTKETSSHTQERMATISHEIKTQVAKSNQSKSNSRQLNESKSKLPSSTKQELTGSKSSTKSKSSAPSSTTKKTTPKQTLAKSSSKSIKPKQSEIINYPSGKIVNSQVLSDVEKGYLELAGFKNYKDAFVGLSTSTKRSSVAKQVAAQTTILSTILKKLELLQIKGVGENVAYALSQVGAGSLQKLSKADSTKLSKKLQSFSKAHDDVDLKVSEKQLSKYIKEAESTPSVF